MLTKSRSILAIFLLLILGNAHCEAAKTVSIFNLLTSSVKNNEKILTSGYLSMTPYGAFLYTTEEAAKLEDFTREIYVSLSVEDALTITKKCGNGNVLLSGVFYHSDDSKNRMMQISDVDTIFKLERRKEQVVNTRCFGSA